MLHYRFYPQEEVHHSGHPVVLLHGLLGSQSNWQSFAKHHSLKQSVISMDLPNHGRSPHQMSMHYSDMAEAVVEVLLELNIQDYDVVGHSMGGKVAMAMALHPALKIPKPQRLIVVDIPASRMPKQHQSLLQSMQDLPLSDLSNRKAIEEALAEQVEDVFERAMVMKNISRSSNGFVWQCDLASIIEQYDHVADFPFQDHSSAIAASFIQGGQSHYINEQNWGTTRSIFPHAKRLCIEGAGHVPHIQTPEGFISMIDDILCMS